MRRGIEQHAKGRVRSSVEGGVETEIDCEQKCKSSSGGSPDNRQRGQRPVTHVSAAPLRRELTLGISTKGAIQTLADAAYFQMALGMHTHSALKSDRQAIIHQQ